MPLDRLGPALDRAVEELEEEGRAKGAERVVVDVFPPTEERGSRVLLEGEGERPFIRMNSNAYLGLPLREEVMEAEERGSRKYGVGPGAVRFISGTYGPHRDLENELARFHGREAGMIFSSAYAAVMGVLTPLLDRETVVVSDELNHNCIINAIRLSRPAGKEIYGHLDLEGLESALVKWKGKARRAVVVTDGIFSMRGSHAPLDEIVSLARDHDDGYPENVVVVVDDSHGVGAFGETGRGVEEYTGSGPADLLVATLGKALGVNGGYLVSTDPVVTYLRETAPFYIYSNPITAGEAEAARAALDLLDRDEGRGLLARLRRLTARFQDGLEEAGFETVPGEHPVVPLMVRETERTRAMARHLFEHGVLATGLTYPVVPKGDESIRFQVAADHTDADLDQVLEILREFQP